MKAKQENKDDQEKKEKTCFVIMPIADMEGYDTGHFSRVYHHLIKPACEKSGFKAIRADDVGASNYIIIDILRKILDSDMVLCDLSGRNPNVLYELGIRQAFNLPTILIKDIKTNKIFDIQGLRYTEYNQTLRVDDVFRDIDLVSQALTETEGIKSTDVNSLIQLLAVKPATRPSNVEISTDTTVILDAIKDLSRRVSSIEFAESKEDSRATATTMFSTGPSLQLKIQKLDSGVFKINGETIEVGEELYLGGKSLGKFADASPTHVLIKRPSGDIASFSASEKSFYKISKFPF